MGNYCNDCKFFRSGDSSDYDSCDLNSLIPLKRNYSGTYGDADGGVLRKKLNKYLKDHWQIDRDLLNKDGKCPFFKKKWWVEILHLEKYRKT